MTFEIVESRAYERGFASAFGCLRGMLEIGGPLSSTALEELAVKHEAATAVVQFVGGGTTHACAFVHPKRRPRELRLFSPLQLEVDTLYIRALVTSHAHRQKPQMLLRCVRTLLAYAKRTDHKNVCFDLPQHPHYRAVHERLQQRFSSWYPIKRNETYIAVRYFLSVDEAQGQLDALIGAWSN